MPLIVLPYLDQSSTISHFCLMEEELGRVQLLSILKTCGLKQRVLKIYFLFDTDGLKNMLKGWWRGLSLSVSCSFILAAKLKALKVILKTWNKYVFGKIELNKCRAMRSVAYWDISRSSDCSLEEVEERKLAREDYKKGSLMEEVSWRQKSRET